MTRDLAVGLFFIIALFILGGLTFMKKGNPFAKTFVYSVMFDGVAGLKKGEQVRVRGLQVGKVGDLTIAPDGILVDIVLEAEIPPRTGYSFEVASASALGGRYVNYEPGSGPTVDTSPFEGSGESADMFESIGNFIEENRESVRATMRNLEDITDQAAEGKGLLGILLRDQDLASDAKAAVASIRRMMENTERGQGVLGALVADEQLASSVRRTVGNIEEITYKVNAGEGTIGMLVNDREMSSSLRRIVRRAEDVLNDVQYGSGLIPRLLSDEELADRASRIFASLDEVALDLRQGRGLVPRLIHDPSMAQNFDDALTAVNDIATRINNGQGTVGRLVASDSLYMDLRSVLRSVREATEDYREQAPINTFVNVLFSAF